VGAAGRERSISHVADGTAPSDAATVRQLGKLRDSAVHYDRNGDDVDYTAVTLGRDAPVSLRNIAPGVRGTDAVNLAQLQDTTRRTLDSANAYTDSRIAPVQNDVWQLGERVDTLERNTEAGIAAAMGLKQAPAVSGRTTYYAGVGGYRSQAALGVSLRRTADNGRWSLEGGVSGNRLGVGGYIGISGVLGR
jgi:autotransporter adhesin